GAFSRRGITYTASADLFQAFLHVRQTVAGGRTQTISGRGLRALVGAALEPPPVINHEQYEFGRSEFEGNMHFGSLGVFDDIVQRFFEGQEDVVPNLGAQHQRWELHWHLEAAANRGRTQVLL